MVRGSVEVKPKSKAETLLAAIRPAMKSLLLTKRKGKG
jgi:hypothetical protein